MPDLCALASATTAKGDPRAARDRRTVLAADLRRITKAFEAEYYTVIPIAQLRDLIRALDEPVEGGD